MVQIIQLDIFVMGKRYYAFISHMVQIILGRQYRLKLI